MNRDKYKPIISIILLSLLRLEETKRCVASILAHTKIPFEIIVVNMGQSAEIINWLKLLSAENHNIKVIFNDENVGTTFGRNLGISASSGQYLIFLDNDTEVTPGWIVPLLKQAEESVETGACGPKIISASGKVMNCAEFVKVVYEGEHLKALGVEFTKELRSDDPQVNHLTEVPWYPSTCLLVKKSALEIVGNFDENIFFCEEDKDLCLRISKAGLKIYYVPQSVVYHHHNPAPGEYAKIRNNMPVLIRDQKYFEQKWNCKVFIKHSRTYLHKSGMNDQEIDRIKKFSFFNTILEEEMKMKELILTVTNRCNHHCRMCYYHQNLNNRSNELTAEEYQKISNSIGKLKILWISGGEPFLRNDLASICHIFVENNQVGNIFIPTNGSQPDKITEVTKQILLDNPGVKLTIMFSLEGTELQHDQIHGKTGAFKAVEESIKKLNFLRVRFFSQQIKFGILLNSVVTTQNIDGIIPLMEYAKTHLMIDSHSLSPMRGEGHDKLQKPPHATAFFELFERAKPYFSFYAKKSKQTPEKIQQFHEWMSRRYTLWHNILSGDKLPFDCQAGNLIGVLEPDGGIRICESKPITANVRDFGYNLPKAWFSAQTDKSRDTKKGCNCTHACFLNVSEKTLGI